jgi:translation initiation factor 1
MVLICSASIWYKIIMIQNKLVYTTQTGRVLNKVQSKPAIKTDGIVRIRLETKGRKGKGMTTIAGVDLPEKELKDLCSQLKKMCGTGGAIKNSIIEIQGDNRDKIKATLEKLGHNVKLAGG